MSRAPPHPNNINRCIDEVTEIARKSIARSELILTKIAIASLCKTAKYYLEKRKNNLGAKYSLEFPLASVNSIDIFLTHVYTALMQLSKAAALVHDENTAIHISKAYAEITCTIANLNQFTASLTFSPIFYLRECLKEAKIKQLDETIFQSAMALLNATKQFSKNSYHQQTFEQIIDCFKESAIYFLSRNKPELLIEVAKMVMQLITHLFYLQRVIFLQFLSYALDMILVLVWIINESNLKEMPFQLNSVLSSVYSPHQNDLCIGHLFAELNLRIKNETTEKSQRDTYSYCVAISETIHKHFIKLANEVDLGSSLLLHDIIKSAKHLMCHITNLIKTPKIAALSEFEDILVKEIKDYLLFFELIFTNKKSISFQAVNKACDVITHLGLQFSELPFFSNEIITICASNIQKLISIYCASNNTKAHEIANLLIFIFHLKLIAEKNELAAVTTKLTLILTTKIDQLDDETWTDCLEQLEVQKRILNTLISKGTIENIFIYRDSAEDLLIQLMNAPSKKHAAPNLSEIPYL